MVRGIDEQGYIIVGIHGCHRYMLRERFLRGADFRPSPWRL